MVLSFAQFCHKVSAYSYHHGRTMYVALKLCLQLPPCLAQHLTASILHMQLYTHDFYRDVVQPKLNPDGIFVTQSGPAGVLSSTEVFTAIHSTLHSVFPSVLPYAQHIPSYNDAWVSHFCIAQVTATMHGISVTKHAESVSVHIPCLPTVLQLMCVYAFPIAG